MNENALDNTTDSATCSFKVYDPGKDELLTAAGANPDVILNVTNAGVFQVGDVIEVDLDDGTVHDAGAIVSLDAAAGTITVTTGLASAAAADKRVRVRLGGEITMSEYGTAKLGSWDFGFIGILPSDHPGLVIDQEIDIEISFVGDPGGGLDALDIICAVIKPLEDCREA